MNINWKPIKEWFGFTRRERRSTFILLLLIAGTIILKYSIPAGRNNITDISESFAGLDIYNTSSGSENGSGRNPSSGGVIKKSLPDQSINKTAYGFKNKRLPERSDPETQYKLKESRQVRSLIELNTSDSAALDRLPGIGPVLSVRIIKYRHLLGGFARIEQLKEVYGLPEETFELIKNRLYIDSTLVIRININSAGYKELSHIHYLEQYDVKAILKYRELNGRINSINDLTDNKLITVEKAMKVKPYLKYEE
jgi:competence ComEA-like helix-hairpin-helix protein